MAGAGDLSLYGLQARYKAGEKPSDIAQLVHQGLQTLKGKSPAFIELVSLADMQVACQELDAMPPASRTALWGTFFAVKDNIDVAALQTTATCPAFAYTPAAHAPTVAALLAAGAVCVGKTNMDQFAAGLNGTRSPYGTPLNEVEPRIIPGGSSSGSASAVAGGYVSFALGTDTAGSGRVPAGLQGIVGLKPSVGMLSTIGVVPACASLDCVSVFSMSVEDGCEVMKVMARASEFGADHTVRHAFKEDAPAEGARAFKFAVPSGACLDFSGPRGEAYVGLCDSAFADAIRRFESIGGERVELDFTPLCDVAKMLYETSFVAERYAGIRAFLELGASPPAGPALRDVSADERLLPVTRAIISQAGKYSAVDLYEDFATLLKRKAVCKSMLQGVDVLLVPTVMHHYLVSELQAQESAEPPTWGYNAKLGTFTNFVNLLDLCAVSLPASSFTLPCASDGEASLTLPFGVTAIGHGRCDANLWRIATRFADSASA